MSTIRICNLIPIFIRKSVESQLNFRRFSTGHMPQCLQRKSKISKCTNWLRFNVHRRNIFLTPILNEQVTVKVPTFDDSITNGDIFFAMQVGDIVNVDDTIASIETDKLDVKVRSPVAGKIIKFLVPHQSTVETNTPVIIIETDNSVPQIEEPNADENTEGDFSSVEKPSPIYGDIQADKNQKISETISTPHFQLPHTRESIIPPAANDFSPTPSLVPPVEISTNENGQTRQSTPVKMSRMRSKIAERLKQSQNTLATLTTFNEIDMSNVIEMRRKYNEQFKMKHGVKLGFMSVFVQACTNALIEFPAINAYIHDNYIIYHNYVDMGIAVSTPKGLVVPVIRNTHGMSMSEIEKLVFALGEKAKNNDITMEDMDGGTFTISNGGIYGGLMGTPIINECQSAILGIYGIKERPIAVNGEVKIRPMTYVALSYDHRLVDGKEAVSFLGRIKELVEDPLRNALNV
ncbi:hypothetical protein GJ496_010654 [Pomphorhynchus laevis]|nr:hypothetical protein GJ496_010654 [Pomphorhynchus laevis]